jgi:hypothetical protein
VEEDKVLKNLGQEFYFVVPEVDSHILAQPASDFSNPSLQRPSAFLENIRNPSPYRPMASNPRLRDAPQKDVEIQDDMGIEEDDDYQIEPPVGVDSISTMMPMSFGKQEKKRDLAVGFAKTKRGTLHAEQQLTLKQENKELEAIVKSVKDDDDEDESSDDMIGPMPAEAESPEEQDSDSDEDDEDDEFPVSHEIVLKDHTKVHPLCACSNTRLFQQLR